MVCLRSDVVKLWPLLVLHHVVEDEGGVDNGPLRMCTPPVGLGCVLMITSLIPVVVSTSMPSNSTTIIIRSLEIASCPYQKRIYRLSCRRGRRVSDIIGPMGPDSVPEAEGCQEEAVPRLSRRTCPCLLSMRATPQAIMTCCLMSRLACCPRGFG